MKLTNQEVFNNAYIGLMKQQRKSAGRDRNGTSRCQYRGHGNTKCAIGFSIPDELYVPSLEGIEILTIIDYAYAGDLQECNDWVPVAELFDDVDRDLLDRLQFIHDFRDVELWPRALKELAERFNLSIPKIDLD